MLRVALVQTLWENQIDQLSKVPTNKQMDTRRMHSGFATVEIGRGKFETSVDHMLADTIVGLLVATRFAAHIENVDGGERVGPPLQLSKTT